MQATATSASDGDAPPPRNDGDDDDVDAADDNASRDSASDSDGWSSCPSPLPRRAAATAGRSVVSSHSSQLSCEGAAAAEAGARALGPAVVVWG